MAQFILGNTLKDRINQWPVLRNSIWWLEALVLGGLMRLLSVLPTDLSSRFGSRLGRWLGPRLPKHRSILRNLRLTFSDKSDEQIEALADQVWGSAGAVLGEYARLRDICRPERTHVTVTTPIRAFEKDGPPAIFVSAHQANWEVFAWALSGLVTDASAPYAPPANPWLARQLIARREPLGLKLLPREGSIHHMINTLDAGGSLALLMDQRIDSGEPVPFFHADKLTTVAPARLAIRFDCELVPVQVRRNGTARYEVIFHPPLKPADYSGDEMERALAMTARINQHFEAWIRQRPGEWFCSNRMWAKRQSTT